MEQDPNEKIKLIKPSKTIKLSTKNINILKPVNQSELSQPKVVIDAPVSVGTSKATVQMPTGSKIKLDYVNHDNAKNLQNQQLLAGQQQIIELQNKLKQQEEEHQAKLVK